MKNLPIVLLIMSFTLGCGLMKRFANSTSVSNSSTSNSSSTSSGSTSSRGDSVPPSGDPKADVITASKKFLDLPQFAATMNGQGKTDMRMDLEYQAPDRFHMTSIGGTNSQVKNEMIIIGKDFYMQFGGRWQKMPNTMGTSMPNLRQYFDEQGLKTLQDVKYDGDDTVDGKPMHIYSYHNSQTNANMPFPFNSKIWVGSVDGLPHKIEVTYEQGELRSMTVNYDFDRSVNIEPPVK